MSIIDITPLPWFLMGLNLGSPLVQGFMYVLTLDWIFEICFMSAVIPWSMNLIGDVIIAVTFAIFPEIVED